MVTTGTLPLQVALAHVIFNVAGILAFYPIPALRLPLVAARWLGRMTRVWRGFPFLYIGVMFFILPILLLCLSMLFQQGSKGMNVLGSFFCIVIFAILLWIVYECNYRGGQERMLQYFAERERKQITYATLPDDMEYLKEQVALLLENTGLDSDSIEDDDDEEEEDAPRLSLNYNGSYNGEREIDA
jgi:solute carrier family 34 (sodium-dependent phosphate cotransporter)